MSSRRILEFDCAGARLVGILDPGDTNACRAVVVVVGGPQYRVGSHRQFLLLARDLAGAGYPVLRFDHRGVGDSEGSTTFEDLDADIRSAIDSLQAAMPAIREVVLWGLCDAASAAMMYAGKDERVAGLVLLNPWVRSDATLARSYFRDYYLRQLFSRQFWARLIGGKLDIGASIRGLADNLVALVRRPPRNAATDGPQAAISRPPFQQRMLVGLSRFAGQVLFVFSGEDLTAREFLDLAEGDRGWRKAMHRPSVTRADLADANHTFASREWRDQVSRTTREWLRSW